MWSQARAWASAFFERFTKEHVLDSAASAAFWLCSSLLPLVAVMMMIVAKVAVADVAGLEPLIASIPESSQELVRRELDRVAAWHGGTVAPVSALVFVWLASTGVHAILDAFDTTLAVDRSWWRKRLLACAICAALSCVVAAVAVLLGVLDHGPTRNVVAILTTGPARYGVAFAAEIGFITALFTVGLHRVGARAHDRRWPGAVVAASLQTLLGYGYVVYVRHLGGGAYATATLATIGVTMMVVYFFTLSLLVGVTFNVVLATRAREP